MIQKSTFDFLKKLKQNNSKDWFDKNRDSYETAKKDVISFIEAVIKNISEFDNSVKNLDAKKCMFRINRDIRFSKDKTPYKTNFGASMNGGGKKTIGPGYYLHIEPGKSMLAGGVYMPEPPQLNAIRQEIDYHFNDFQKILSNKEFKKWFGGLSEEDDKLKTVPKGYAKENPAIEILKNKHFIVVHNLKDDDVLGKNAVKNITAIYKAMYPLNVFLGKAIG